MSHGDEFPSKQALVPRSFAAIVAYDGHRSDVGRVVTDATWHHFININIDGTGATGREGLMPGGSDTPEMTALRQHWVNLADWLMPAKVRRCRRWPFLFEELHRYPLWEIARIPDGDAELERLEALGDQVVQALAARLPGWRVASLVEDAFIEAAGGRAKAAAFLKAARRFGEVSSERAGIAALGAGLAEVVRAVEGVKEADRGAIEEAALKGMRRGLSLSVRRMREDVDRLRDVLEPLDR